MGHRAWKAFGERPLLWGSLFVLVTAAIAALATLWLWLGLDSAGLEFGVGRTGADFRTFTTAGHLVSEGASGLVYASAPYVGANAPLFVYPMWFAALMVPISAVGAGIGYSAWIVGTAVAMFFCYFVVGQRKGLMVAAVMTISIVGYQQVLFGQSAFLLAAISAVVVWALSEQRYAIGGLAIAFMGFKPHIAAVLFLICVFEPRLRPAIGWAIGGSLTLLAIGEAVEPGSTLMWLDTVASNHHNLVDPSSEFTVRAAVEALFGVSFPVWAKLLPLAAAGVWLWSVARRKDLDIGTLALCALGLGVVLGPHSLGYDLLVVGPAVALALRTRPADRNLLSVAGIVALSAITVAPFLRVAISDLALIPVPVLSAGVALFLVYFAETVQDRVEEGIRVPRVENAV